MFGNVRLKIRPIRLGFLVDPAKASEIQRAIELNSSLWGGVYNPIIPVSNRLPTRLKRNGVFVKSATELTNGYISAFDPDIIVQITQRIPKAINLGGRTVIRPAEVWEHFDYESNELTPQFGVGVIELLDQIYDEHFRYVERHPISIDFPRMPKKARLFWSALFGAYPARIHDAVTHRYRKAIEIQQSTVTPDSFVSLLTQGIYYPTRITRLDLNKHFRTGSWQYATVFLLDTSSPSDVLEFWNLRALGKTVFPVPLHLSQNQEVCDAVAKFVASIYRPHHYNQEIYYSVHFIPAHSCSQDGMKAFTRAIHDRLTIATRKNQPPILSQHWYPRIWDEWARDKDEADPCDVWVNEHTIDYTDVNRRIQFACEGPQFLQDRFGYGKPRCANEITMRFYDNKEYMASVLPRDAGENTRQVVSSVTSFRDDCRIGRNGLIKLENSFLSEYWDVPLAQDVFFAWLKDRGFESELSTPGLIARQLYAQAEGNMRVFKNHQLLQLFEEMNGGPKANRRRQAYEGERRLDNREITAIEREKEIGDIKIRLREISSTGHLYETLLARKVFRLGSKVKCPHCARHQWYTLDSLKESMLCPKCLNSFDALGRVDEGRWCYKTAGPFSVPGYADGSFCVLFALEQLMHRILNMEVTPSLSFNARANRSLSLEADFGALYRQVQYGVVHDGVIFGECKSYNDFQPADINRMRVFADSFPGAILAFCTLKRDLSTKEKKLITSLAKRGRRHWKHEKPLNPVLILTERELFAEFSLPQSWSDLEGGKRFEHAHGILEICDATQQLYLGLPSWHQTWHEKWEGRRKRKSAN